MEGCDALEIPEGDGRFPKSSTPTIDAKVDGSFSELSTSTADVEVDAVKDKRYCGDLQEGLGLLPQRVYRFKVGQAPLLRCHIFSNVFMLPCVKCFSQKAGTACSI